MTANPDRAGPELPRWFVAGLAAALACVVTAGSLGVVLLALGWYEPAPVIAASVLAAAAVAYGASRRLGSRSVAHGPAIVAVGLAVVFFALAGGLHSEHLLTDRDPGVYINEARSIVRTHELDAVARVGPFRATTFGASTPGFAENRHGRLIANFLPMLPVELAIGWSVGGETGMLIVPAILGTLGLLAAYALASRLVGPRAALAALLLLAIIPLQLWFSRDAYSELVVQVVALGGLWLYLEARARTSAVFAVVAGVLIGSSALARIDVLAITVGLVAFAGVDWIRCDGDAIPERSRRVVAAFLVSLLLATGAAFALMYGYRRGYVRYFASNLRGLGAVLALALAGVVGMAVVHRIRPGIGARVLRHRALMPTATAAASVVFAWAYWLRPDSGPRPRIAVGQKPTKELAAVISNWHGSWSLHWFSSYIGVFALAGAFAGLALLGRDAREGRRAATAVFFFVVPVTLLYVASPSITSDQPWAMRRYLPVVIPGIAIGLTALLAALWSAAQRPKSVPIRTLAVAGVVAVAGLVTVPSAVAWSTFAGARMQHGAERAVTELCHQAGNDSAVLVYGHRFVDLELPQTVREFCGVPVAVPENYGALNLHALADAWHRLDRRLLVATADPDAVRRAAPGATTTLAHLVIADDREPERVFDRRPRRYDPRPFEVWLLEITP